jgi:hypothetical protein
VGSRLGQAGAVGPRSSPTAASSIAGCLVLAAPG